METPGHRHADVGELLNRVQAMSSGRPKPELILAWVMMMVGEEDLVDSKDVAHTFRCDEAYVCWCCEVGVRRGALERCQPIWRLAGVSPPVEAWMRSRLDPLAQLALEAQFDAAAAALATLRPPTDRNSEMGE